MYCYYYKPFYGTLFITYQIMSKYYQFRVSIQGCTTYISILSICNIAISNPDYQHYVLPITPISSYRYYQYSVIKQGIIPPLYYYLYAYDRYLTLITNTVYFHSYLPHSSSHFFRLITVSDVQYSFFNSTQCYFIIIYINIYIYRYMH